jgi:hypothetical protein
MMADDKDPMVTIPQAEKRDPIDYREVGATGLRRFSGFIYEEFLRELTGWSGMAVYKEMASNDATVTAILYAIEMLCRRVTWRVENASQETNDMEAGEFLESNMDDMSMTWTDTIVEILSMLTYGYSIHEIVYKRRCGDVLDPSMRSKYSDGRIGWRKLPIRSQDTIYRWQFDDNGGIQGVEQLAPPHYYHTTIPVEKFLLFRTTVAKNNPEGRSVLRGAYRSWYFKKNMENIEGIGVERDLAGLPVALVPPELLSSTASPVQKALLNSIKDIVTNVKRDEQEGLVFPLQYDANGKLMFEFKLLSSGGSRQLDTGKIIARYDQQIARVALADFILLGHENVGSFALASSKTDLFATAIGGFLDVIAEVFNRYAIPRLFALNDFKLTNFPKIVHGDLQSVDLKELGMYLQALASSGMPLFPSADGELEKYLLKAGHLPEPPHGATMDSLHVDQDDNETNDENAPKAKPAIADAPGDKPVGDELAEDTDPVNQKPPTEMATTNESGDTEVQQSKR